MPSRTSVTSDSNRRFTSSGWVLDSRIRGLERVCYGHIRDLSFSVSAGENVLLLDRSNTIIDELSDLLVGEEEPGSGIILPMMPGKERKKESY